ncbi:MAG: SDR family oxidoreductase [Holophagales bacterium]|nr:SDR family oxidoreductase [Holophagales bacterium]MYA07111.1 SDR family oxidoreductase [Holophagales bacterium]MYC09470.1 SDR family oxidoreductase [Holophagales bacterium]MYG29615.1 SDR family oxidoreductase [Holophagales bacterium]MYI79867.1 SDR family oxidoreductase [Holophagales bacterium]
MDLGIHGKKAAVAAASTGLGFGCAKALLEDGVDVAICSRSEERIREAAATLGAGAVPIVADMSTEEGARSFVEQATEKLGQVDILVANAGGPPPGSPATTSIDGYRQALDLNLLSTIVMCQAALPGMRERGWGRIVAITSIGARQPIGNLAASSVARAGVSSFLKTLSTEVARDGVTVNSAQPGIHATDRIKSLGNTDVVAQRVPTGTLGTAEDFGKAVAFLCSEPARFITGTSILLDGGAYPGLI